MFRSDVITLRVISGSHLHGGGRVFEFHIFKVELGVLLYQLLKPWDFKAVILVPRPHQKSKCRFYAWRLFLGLNFHSDSDLNVLSLPHSSLMM